MGYWLVFVKLLEISLCGIYCVCDYLAMEKSLILTIIASNDLFYVAWCAKFQV